MARRHTDGLVEEDRRAADQVGRVTYPGAVTVRTGSDARVGDSTESDLAQVGLAILKLRVQRSSRGETAWVHRRVECLEFLDTRAVRWRISVDFDVPLTAPLLSPNLRLVPVTTLRKSHLVNFDLRDENGAAVWLPTSIWISARLTAALAYLASRVPGVGDPDDSLEVTLSRFGAAFDRIVSTEPPDHRDAMAPYAAASAVLDAHERLKEAEKALACVSAATDGPCRLLDLRKRWTRQPRVNRASARVYEAEVAVRKARSQVAAWPQTESRTAAALMTDTSFRSLLEELSQNFIVLVPVADTPSRRIVKLAFEGAAQFERPKNPLRRLLWSIGWSCWRAGVNLGARGGSEHLEVAAPPGVDIVRILADPVDPQPGGVRLRSEGDTPHVHIVMPSQPYHRRYMALILLRVSRPGWLTASWLVALLIATVVGAGRENLQSLYSPGSTANEADTAATLLLALLAVIAAVLVRPSEHPLASRLLLLARLLILIDAVVVLVGTGSLVLHRGSALPETLWTVLAWVAGAVALLLTLSRALPVAHWPPWYRRRPYSTRARW
jgi:hypothetical protein